MAQQRLADLNFLADAETLGKLIFFVTNYDGLLEEFSEEVIQSRYAVFYEEIEEFAKSLGIREKIQISESLLSHAVLDYFTDISRLKHFHQAKHINSLKVISYETYWLLRRKPIQILVEDETSDAMAFLNEKFVFSRIAKYLMGDGKRVILSPETKKGFLNYLDSLFYYLKYRNYDAEMLEMNADGGIQRRGGGFSWRMNLKGSTQNCFSAFKQYLKSPHFPVKI